MSYEPSTASNRVGERMERGFDDVRGEPREVKSDRVLIENRLLMENRVLTPQSDVLRPVRRVDDGPDSDPDTNPRA